MERIPVRSSNVRSIGYRPDNQILEVEFKTGSIYQYFGVTFEKHERLMKSRSKGEYLSLEIKGQYRCSKC